MVDAGRACLDLGVDLIALEPARSAGLLAASRELAFRHPFIRSAVYDGASAADRRAALLALAEATDPATHPDAWVWHLADSTTGQPCELGRRSLARLVGGTANATRTSRRRLSS